jgi:hypothetical protein
VTGLVEKILEIILNSRLDLKKWFSHMLHFKRTGINMYSLLFYTRYEKRVGKIYAITFSLKKLNYKIFQTDIYFGL